MKRLFTAGLFLALALPLARADDDKDSRRSLRGLGPIQVVAEDLDTEAADVGLTTQDLRTDVELRLRQAGVKVIDSSLTFLYVNVQMMKGKYADGRPTGLYAAASQLALHQPVVLIRDPTITLAAARTWSVGGLSMASQGEMRSHCRGALRDLVDKFLNAYLEQNPK